MLKPTTIDAKQLLKDLQENVKEIGSTDLSKLTASDKKDIAKQLDELIAKFRSLKK